jgi:penicillin-binding protein 1A
MINRLPKWLKYSLLFLGALLIALGTFFILLFSGGFGSIPNEKELKDIQNESASLVYASDGSLIGKFFEENRTNLAYDSLPENLINALIATEDARFYEHEGVDGRALFRVLLKTMIMGDRSSGGGSTLSQQLAKNLYGRKDFGKFSIAINKLKEIILANRLENLYSKKEIIELYLNTVPFGENLYGVEAASLRYFSKSANELQIEESAVLVGLLKANSFYNPRLHPENAKERRNVVISQMAKYEYISASMADSLQKLDLKLAYRNLDRENITPYFLDRLKKEAVDIITVINEKEGKEYNIETDGLEIVSTLDIELQQNLYAGMRIHLKKMQNMLRRQYAKGVPARKLNRLVDKLMSQNKLTNSAKTERLYFDWEKGDTLLDLNTADSLKYILTQLQSGAFAMDANDGAIRSWIGGIHYRYYPYDQVRAERQLASTFKPILYAAALNEGFSACDYLSNEEVVLTDYNDWAPTNYDGTSGGEFSLAAALALSKNLPTLDLYLQTGWEAVNQMWDTLGFIEDLNKEPSVILGTNSASLLQLVKAYASFANGGYEVAPYTIERISTADGQLIYQKESTKQKRVLEKELSLQMNEILAKTVNEGTANAIRSRYGIRNQLAAKTGTSKDYADAWTVIYNNDLVCGIRVGASLPSIHFNSGSYGSSSRLALPILGEALKREKYRRAEWITAGLNQTKLVDCENFREIKGIEKVFQIFRKKETSLEDAEKRSKRKGLFKRLFGK